MRNGFHVLVVDDNRSTADGLAQVLGQEGCLVRAVHGGEEALALLRDQAFDLVLTDLFMEPVDGLTVVRAARALPQPPEVIVFTGFGTVESAVEAMRLGARDFLTKPVSPDILRQRVAEVRGVPPVQGGAFVGESPFTRSLLQDLDLFARVPSPVLVRGEAGTGRGTVARWLHDHGNEPARPFQVVDPLQDPGASGPADPGTLVVRRLDALTPGQAAGVLRLLDRLPPEDGPRLVATCAPGWGAATGSVPDPLLDLYFRFAVIVVDLPPLRERREDVLPLVQHFAARFAASFGRQPVVPTASQEEALLAHGWPGNVRELANLVERAVVLGPAVFDAVGPQPAVVAGRPAAGVALPRLPDLAPGFDLAVWLDEMERALLERAMQACAGDRNRMSTLLNVERNTLRYKLRKYGLLDRAE